MRLSGTQARSISSSRGLGNTLWDLAGNRPSLDLRFADSKSLVDATTGTNLVAFTRASSGTYVGSDGLIKTATTNEPRFDHDPATGESLGLLVEEQRTNVIRNNTMVGAVAGTPGTLPTNWFTSGFSGLTREVVGISVVNGVTCLDVRYSGTVSTTFGNILTEAATQIAATNGQSWAGSAWVQVLSGSTSGLTSLSIAAEQRDSGGGFLANVSAGTASAAVDTSFQRINRIYTTTNASIAFIVPVIQIGFTNGAAIDITLRIGLPQLEQGAFATSVIPTTTSAVTRAADVASISGSNFSSWYNASEGTVLWKGTRATSGGFPDRFRFSDGTLANRYFAYWDAAASSSTFEVIANSTQQTAVYGGQGAINTSVTAAYGIAANNTSVVYDGVVRATDTSVTLPVVNQLSLAQGLTGHISRFTFWPSRLPNSTLQGITQ